jgi:hypothetical protein
MLRRVALVITDVSEERIASIIRETTIGELGTTLAVTSNQSTLRRNIIIIIIIIIIIMFSSTYTESDKLTPFYYHAISV